MCSNETDDIAYIRAIDDECGSDEVASNSIAPQSVEAPSCSTNEASVETSVSEPKRMRRSSSSRNIANNSFYSTVQPINVIEYEWPLKSGERYFIQEQIAELLDIKSFKRKYPHLTRRPIDWSEKEHLLVYHNLASVMSETEMRDMNALRAIEIHELMANDYSLTYSEYQKALADRVKLQMTESQRQLDAIKMDSIKMKEFRQNCIRSTIEFNSEINSDNRSKRKYFWDIQTSIIQSRQNRWKKVAPCASRPGAYPVALLTGQYSHYYKRYTREEMRRMPLLTVLDCDHLMLPKRGYSPPPIVISEEELPENAADTAKDFANNSPSLSNGVDISFISQLSKV